MPSVPVQSFRSPCTSPYSLGCASPCASPFTSIPFPLFAHIPIPLGRVKRLRARFHAHSGDFQGSEMVPMPRAPMGGGVAGAGSSSLSPENFRGVA